MKVLVKGHRTEGNMSLPFSEMEDVKSNLDSNPRDILQELEEYYYKVGQDISITVVVLENGMHLYDDMYGDYDDSNDERCFYLTRQEAADRGWHTVDPRDFARYRMGW